MVTVTGPRQSVRTRRKARVLGIWVNVDFARIRARAVVSGGAQQQADRRQIANTETLRRQQVGLNNVLLTQRIGPDIADTVPTDPFRAAFVRLEREQQLYFQAPTAVTYLTPTVFRAAIPLPADLPTGITRSTSSCSPTGVLVGRANTALEVIKAGFEQYVADAARDHGLLYGLAHHADGAAHRLDRQRGVPEGLVPPGSAWRRRHKAGPRRADAR